MIWAHRDPNEDDTIDWIGASGLMILIEDSSCFRMVNGLK